MPKPKKNPSSQARNDSATVDGQESNYTIWRLAKINFAIRGVGGQIAHGDTFHDGRQADLRADFILANPPIQRLRQWRRPPAGRQTLEV